MSVLVNTLAAVAVCAVLAADALAHSAVVPFDNEPAPRLIVEPPLREQLAKGVVFIPYRVENLRILPVGGAAARNLSRGLAISTSPSTTCPGSGRITATATPSSWWGCRAASTRC
jgi:hypothetical protein